MNRNSYIASCLILLCAACADFSDPTIEIAKSYTFMQEGENQKAFAGDYLTDSITVVVYDNVTRSYLPGMDVHFEIISGDGEVDHEMGFTDIRGRFGTRWKLGGAVNEQIVKALIYTPSGEFRTEIPFYGTGIIRNSWNTIKNYPDIYISDMVADSLSGITLALANSTFYRQGEKFFEWNQATDISINSPRRIIQGRDRKLYVGTWDGKLYKSNNQGEGWTECTKPWPDHSYYYHLQVTSNNYLWATAIGRGLRCSRDGGQTWSTDTIGLPAAELLGDIFRLSDGTLFFLSLNCNLSKSVDDGHSWTKVNTPQYSLKLHVTNQDELILINQDYGISIYKSANKGLSFSIMQSVMPGFHTFMDHTVHRWGNDFYLLIPGYGILHTTDFEHFNPFWINQNVDDMLMDAYGNLLVTEMNNQKVYYYNMPQ
jgi:hypothetical protein